jgi:tRNA/rRNA methyltransferase
MNNLFLRLENALDEKGFFHNKHRQSATMRNIKNMISRAELTDQEVRTYHGIISMLIKNDS